MPLSSRERERYHRHLVLPEIDTTGQEKLRAARVLMVGVGGLGSPAALYLAAAGIGTLGLLDSDAVDISNLQRQVLYDTASVSRGKTAVARERLQALNPDITVREHALELTARNAAEILSEYDLVLDGTDRLTTRYLVNDACVLGGKPLVSAAIHRFEGQAMTYVPGRGPCYRCLFPVAPQGLIPSCAEAGVLGVLPGVLGAIQATEAIKLIVGVGEPLVGRLLAFDALAMHFEELRFERREDCAVCGARPTITSLQASDAPGSIDATRVRRLSPRELREQLARAHGALIDVREPREFALDHLPEARNIPVGELPRQLAALPRDTTPIFLCRTGTRSLAACEIALRSGFVEAAHLEGGLLAWAASADPTFKVAPLA